MQVDPGLKNAVRTQLSATDLRDIESLTRYCFESSLAPILYNSFSDGFEQLFSKLENTFARLSSGNWPKHFFYSPHTLMLLELMQDMMREFHVRQFLDVELYRSAVQSKCPKLASIINLSGDDAGLVSFQNAISITAKKGIRLELDQAIPGTTNASRELQEVMGRFRDKQNVFVRPNAFRLVDIKSSIEFMEKAVNFARPINKDWLNKMAGEESAEHVPGEHSFSPKDCRVQYLFTRLDTKLGKEEIEFSCEELPDRTDHDIQCTRFIHGIYRPNLGKFDHFDGAIHFYESNEYADRCTKHLKQRHKGYRKAKIFRIDELLDFEDAGLLISTFFRWNSVAPEYFTPLMAKS